VKRFLFLLLFLLCGCAAPVSEPETGIPAAEMSVQTVEQGHESDEIRQILERAETLETETAGSGLKWCSLAADLLDYAASGERRLPAGISEETLSRLYAAAMLLTGRHGPGILEDCGHAPLRKQWSSDSVNALFSEFLTESAANYAEFLSKCEYFRNQALRTETNSVMIGEKSYRM